MKIILYIAISIDGFIARKNGSVDWLDKYNKSGEDHGYNKFMRSISSVIVGNTTQTQFPQDYQGKPCYVFSRKKHKPSKNIKYVKGSAKTFLKNHKLKGKVWMVGGAKLIDHFLKADLIDEFMIHTIPECIGEGIPLFTTKKYQKQFKVVTTKTFKSGIVLLHYKKK